MSKSTDILSLTLVLSLGGLASESCCQPIPAFPGADGAAAYVSGGRDLGGGQIVYHVTKLDSAIDDAGRFDIGTLRYGLNSSNFPAGVPRTIVFDVGGVFNLGRLPQSGWDPNGNGWDAQSRLTIGGANVTLAGQTAPGAGVIFMGGGLKPQGNNNIIRNITVASGYGMRGWWKPGEAFPAQPDPQPSSLGPGIFPDATVFDGMDISGTNLMIDHVSALFATDETISMNEVADNITIQYSNISQGLNYPQWDAEGGGFTGHALGSLFEAGAESAISLHHNLYAHQKGRLPQMQGSSAYYDIRNNVFYNWLGTAGSRRGSTRANLVGNFYLAGPGGDDPIGGSNSGLSLDAGGSGVLGGSSSVFRDANLLDSNKDGDPDDGSVVSGGATLPLWSRGVDTYAGLTESADATFDRVLDFVGANWWQRDSIIDSTDERIIHETRTGTGKIIAWADDPWNEDPQEGQEWRDLVATPAVTRSASWDTEPDIGYGMGDGMPTQWELRHGLDPTVRDDAGDFDSDGYTNLEEYLNEIAAWPAPAPILFNNARGDGRFAHILNWDANPEPGSVHPWQPSRFDTAVVDNATVTVDAVGQHAGNLLLATGPGDDATFNVTDGWIVVEENEQGLSDGAIVIADHPTATAELNLAGGVLVTKSLLRGAGGTFNFTGGTLSAEMIGFDLENQGGTIAPGGLAGALGNSFGSMMVEGDLIVFSGELSIEIGPDGHDQIRVSDDVTLGGTLDVSILDQFELTPGMFFEIIDVDGQLHGEFSGLAEGETIAGFAEPLFITYSGGDGNDVVLNVGSRLPGDYNQDGVVNIADYTVWRDGLGTMESVADGDGDGTIGLGDYVVWQSQFGAANRSVQSPATIPEPSSGLVAVLLVALHALQFNRRVSGLVL